VSFGLLFVVVGLYLAVVPSGTITTEVVFVLVLAFIVLGTLLGALWKIRGTLDVAWAPDEPFANPAPERTTSDYSLSNAAFVTDIEEAGENARGGTVEDGITSIRPLLRETLCDTLVQSGRSHEEAQRMLADGTWTDDRIAASVLDSDIPPPRQSLRERVRAWLFPEKVVRQHVRRATQAVAETADETLSTVPGQNAPRTVPIVQPRLEDLWRDADGSLQRAVDPMAVARGPRPIVPDLTHTHWTESESEPGSNDESIPETDDREDSDTNEKDGADTGEGEHEHTTGDGRLSDDRNVSVRQRRWRGAVTATAILAVSGLIGQNGVLVLAAVLPLAYIAVGALSSVDPPEGLSATRSIEPSLASPGRPVTVTLTVQNESDRTMPDIRVADGVPDKLAVLEGTPRAGTTLEPGESCEMRYLVVARRGEYTFDPPQIRVRDLGAGSVVTTNRATDGDRSLSCRFDADAPPIDERGDGLIGQLTTNRPGEGVSFHSVREYHPNDPANRIDWRHYAKRESLATVNYERPVAATVVLVVDARPLNRVIAGPGQPTAIEFAAYAATRALTDLLRSGHDVGVAVIGLDGPGPAGVHWLSPASGREQRSRAREMLRVAADAGNATSNLSEFEREPMTVQVNKVLELAPLGTQFALFSPLLDSAPVEAVETWRGAGFPVVALSPDVVSENTVSGQYEQVRRRTRLARCQSIGARAVDWRRGTPLPRVIEHAFAADARLSRNPGPWIGGGG
jgi:uncharacterized protein (DUF58 family)